MERRFAIDRGSARRRLDRVILERLPDAPGVSRNRVQAWIRAGRVRVDGRPAERAAQRLREGQQVDVELPDPPRRVHAPEPIALRILHEDEWLIAVDKPAGLVVHPTRRHPQGTLVNALLWHMGAAGAGQQPPGDDDRCRVRLVHRLDRDTSGVLLVARSREVLVMLARAMARRAITKEYLAVVYGVPRSVRDRIDLRIARNAEGRLVCSRHEGRPASTLIELVAASSGPRAGLSLLRCTLLTGRLHQIRVHLAGIGLPLVGDPLYGSPRWKGIRDPDLAALCAGFTRQALHAWRLSGPHPVTRRPLTLTAPLPTDVQRLLDAAGLVPEASAL